VSLQERIAAQRKVEEPKPDNRPEWVKRMNAGKVPQGIPAR